MASLIGSILGFFVIFWALYVVFASLFKHKVGLIVTTVLFSLLSAIILILMKDVQMLICLLISSSCVTFIPKLQIKNAKQPPKHKKSSNSVLPSKTNTNSTKFLDYGVYPITQFIDEKSLIKELRKIVVITGQFYKSSINENKNEICISDEDNISNDTIVNTIKKLISLENEKIEYSANNNNDKNYNTFVIILSIFGSIILACVLILTFLIPKNNKNDLDSPESLTELELEIAGTYIFSNAKYVEYYNQEPYDFYYPDGPKYFKEATTQYLESKIKLYKNKVNGQISGSLFLPTETYHFTWTRPSKNLIKLNKNIYFNAGNDSEISLNGVDCIFIADDSSSINVCLLEPDLVFYYFEKLDE